MVLRKFKEDKREDIPEITNPKMIKSRAIGDRFIRDVLNGGQMVHAVAPPNSKIIDNKIKIKEVINKNKEKRLIRGNPTSGAGTKPGIK